MNGECHYRGYGRGEKKPVRIVTLKEGALYYFNIDDVPEEKLDYIKGLKSFLNPHKGLGIYKDGDKVFVGVYLYGVQTLMFFHYGYGRHACCDYNPYESYFKLEDFQNSIAGDKTPVIMNSLRDSIDSLDETERENILEEFNKVLALGNTGLLRRSSPEKAKADQPIIDEIVELLSA